MKTCDFFSACAEDLKKAVNPNDNEAMIMIGMFPNDDRATVVINGIGVNIVAALCAAFDSNKNFKKMAMLALETLHSKEFANRMKEK